MNLILQPQNTTKVTAVVYDKENPDARRSLVIYGSNKSCPEFVPKHDKGARILLLAYAR